ncbi:MULTISPECIES: YggS family pyridoxal phosphate-dependent enzyme [unclassified Paracoccus (in: a-proteobacteria)]|uniref:YggS family pyridoxal phosphate-dependent enzyme n=1 Tax=unclassified Paracoccus (in: a-proteobacteria) TaxID=2688777 RepID=UPI0012B2EBE4|nr:MULTISPECIES: YggS family pyridoxal phosphate-dependent enzyme [unclassified Paracoccus (in: a-proteobacteria)]UXU75791.1 YggS family pyridoxal phosphate-dependent enzyme [Paracoccus sp. SMMA_5]UXU81700.1 YggS family pyridoxal phosphate-dependent enzyme [Paracoccus sp. SMMA_5_TC]
MGLDDIRGRIDAAATAAGRSPGDVTLIAVSKVQPPARVQAVLAAGHRVFGENYVQEAAGKWPQWRQDFPGVELHMIGPLQSNKLRQALELFDAIHSLDRPSLAQKLARQVQARGRCPQLFVQINTGAEPQKAGVLPAEADRFLSECRAMDLALAGLMCIPPEDQPPQEHFRLLAQIAHQNGLSGLSMGMSADFEVAIALGATHVRIGSAIFGQRSYGDGSAG